MHEKEQSHQSRSVPLFTIANIFLCQFVFNNIHDNPELLSLCCFPFKILSNFQGLDSGTSGSLFHLLMLDNSTIILNFSFVLCG